MRKLNLFANKPASGDNKTRMIKWRANKVLRLLTTKVRDDDTTTTTTTAAAAGNSVTS